MTEALLVLVALGAGALAALVALRPQLRRLAGERDLERDGRLTLDRKVAELTAALELERQAAGERVQLKAEVADAVKVLSAEALQRLQTESRSDLDNRQRAVQQSITPLKESLEKVDASVREIERARVDAYGRLVEQIETVSRGQGTLRDETANLVKALRAPAVRGRWGEMHLQRALELAGLVEHRDFDRQTVTSNDGQQLRPDVVVHLPGDRTVVIDAKVPLEAFLEAHETDDDERRLQLLRDHARQLRDHVVKLSAKGYASQFQVAPDFVLMFIPIESILGDALVHDPTLLEESFRRRVHLVTPTSLISNLRTIAQIWRDEAVAENARIVSALGKELYERTATLAGHFNRLGKSLDAAVSHYNGTVGSLESRVLVSARRFSELGVSSGEEIPPLEPIDRATRPLQAPELVQMTGSVRTPSSAPEVVGEEAEDVPDAA
jgi:DNA recombination protein RmuC